MQFLILGPLEILDAAQTFSCGRPQVRQLISILALAGGAVVPSVRLRRLLRESAEPPLTSGGLASAMHNARSVLPDGTIRREGGGYRLVLGGLQDVDALQFSDLVSQAKLARRSGQAEQALELLTNADGLWRSGLFREDPLPDLPQTSSMVPQRAALLRERRRVRESRAELALELGLHEDLDVQIRAYLDDDPGNEQLTRFLMVALYRSGHRHEALSVFEEATAAKAAPPGPWLVELRDRILVGEPGLLHPASSGVSELQRLERRLTELPVKAPELAQWS